MFNVRIWEQAQILRNVNWYISFMFRFGINSGLQIKREGNCKEGTFIDDGFHRNGFLIVIEVL